MAAYRPFRPPSSFNLKCPGPLLLRRHIETFNSFPGPRRGILARGVVVVGLGCAAVLALKVLKAGNGDRQVLCEAATGSVRKRDGSQHHPAQPSASLYRPSITQAKSVIKFFKEEIAAPGLVVAVSVDRKMVWSEGFGFADVENNVQCSPATVMRIASISKPLTATAVARLWEEGKLDLDAPVQKYVPAFPEKTFKGRKVTITARHLLSHLGGIRHYEKTVESQKEGIKSSPLKSSSETKDSAMTKDKDKQQKDNEGEFDQREYYIKDHYDSVTDSLILFQDDPLLSEPGTTFHYTTHGWTLLSAVIEGAAKQEFLKYMKQLFRDLGMENTCAEFNDSIIYNRARFYQRGKKGILVNAPYVDNSYKWAGGGFMSTAEDLIHFGNALLYAKQIKAWEKRLGGGEDAQSKCLTGILQPDTMEDLWKIVTSTKDQSSRDSGYCMGWTRQAEKQEFGACRHQKEIIQHSGAAVGCSSILLIQPIAPSHLPSHGSLQPPMGIVVSILVNLQEVDLRQTAQKIAECFEKSRSSKEQPDQT